MNKKEELIKTKESLGTQAYLYKYFNDDIARMQSRAQRVLIEIEDNEMRMLPNHVIKMKEDVKKLNEQLMRHHNNNITMIDIIEDDVKELNRQIEGC